MCLGARHATIIEVNYCNQDRMKYRQVYSVQFGTSVAGVVENVCLPIRGAEFVLHLSMRNDATERRRSHFSLILRVSLYEQALLL